MAIVPLREEVLFNIIHCPECDNYFSTQTGMSRVSCCVAHSPGSCCHYGDRPLTVDQVKEVRVICER